jgi:ribosomal protein L33
MLLFVLFNSKRKQKIINVIKPNSNATLAFTETVGRLYYQHKNNRRIADKMITYFYENIRNKYFINTTHINTEFINSLSGKSGLAPGEVSILFNIIKNIQLNEIVTDEELLELNERIDNFNNYKS